MKEIKKIKNPPFCISKATAQSLSYRFRFFIGLSHSTRCGCVYMATAAKFVLQIPIFFLAYQIPLDVDVTGNITQNFVKIGVKLKMFAPWLPWQRPPF